MHEIKQKGEQMKNAKVLNFKLWLLAFTVFGCTQSPQITEYRDTTAIDNLILEAGQIIREGLADNDPRIRAKAVEVVAATRQIGLMPNVQRLLTDDFVPVRFAAVLAVGDTEYLLAKRPINRLLKDPDENVRIAAAYAMKKLGSDDSFGLLGRAIAGKDQKLRANATVLLGKSGDESALKLLYWVMKDRNSDDKVRFQAVEAIARLGDEQIVTEAWKMLISAYADDRVMGIRAVGAMGTTQAKDILITKLDDDILEVRLAAAQQLGMLGSSAGETAVLDVFTKNLAANLEKKDVERVNVLTALAIGQIGTDTLKKFLPQLLKNESKLVRLAAANAVFNCQTVN